MTLQADSSSQDQDNADLQANMMDELLRQQDDALQQLEELDQQILSVIKEVTDRTKAENEAAADAAAKSAEDSGISRAA